MHGATFPLALHKIRRGAQQVSDAARRVSQLAARIGAPAGVQQSDQGATPKYPRIPGFRHLFGEPKSEQRFRIYGDHDPLAEENHLDLQILMGRLAKRMSADIDWPAHQDKPATSPSDNPNVPAGYTYLLQLIAHDLVQTSVPVSIIEDTTTGTLNVRRRGLRLDTIYGGGPLVTPAVYALDDVKDETRTKLRLMKIRPDEDIQPRGCPFRDIPRAAPTGMNGQNRSTQSDGHLRPSLTDPMIADVRNDSHVILSQMTALFHHLHNGITDLLPPIEPEPPAQRVNANSKWEAAYERYLCARGAVTLIYRNIIRKDLMSLILRNEIYSAYEKQNCAFLDSELTATSAGDGWTIPLEFSHGAFRFGHSMIRDKYLLNNYSGEETVGEIIKRTSAKEPQNTPLTKEWLVRWSHFFHLKQVTQSNQVESPVPRFSRRIGPHFNNFLASEGLFPPLIDSLGAARAETQASVQSAGDFSAGLAYRDLMSASLLGLWSVGSLIEEIRRKRPDFIALSPLLDKPEYREQRIAEWLADSQGSDASDRLDERDIEFLAKDPPLPFFILFEAATESDGLRLGVLGSILVAEVMFRGLREDLLPPEVGAKNLNEALASLSRSIYGDEKYLAAVRHEGHEISTMGQLIEFAARRAELEDAVPAFL